MILLTSVTNSSIKSEIAVNNAKWNVSSMVVK